MTLKSLLWRKKYVMTSKIRHDIKKFLMMLNTSWRQKVRGDVKKASWDQKVRQNTSWYTKITRTSKIRKKYVMTFDLFPEYFLTTIDPQLTKCDIGLWTYICSRNQRRMSCNNAGVHMIFSLLLFTKTSTLAGTLSRPVVCYEHGHLHYTHWGRSPRIHTLYSKPIAHAMTLCGVHARMHVYMYGGPHVC